MLKLFNTALAAVFLTTTGLSLPATAAQAASTRIETIKTAKMGKQPGVRRAKARMRRPLAKPVDEHNTTADLNRQSLQNAQGPLSEANTAPAQAASEQDDPPLNHPLPESLERFDSANKMTKEGWTSTLGLLPAPESKLSIPSPDVRLQERGIHLGAMYRF